MIHPYTNRLVLVAMYSVLYTAEDILFMRRQGQTGSNFSVFR
jgi:hypothetical protein